MSGVHYETFHFASVLLCKHYIYSIMFLLAILITCYDSLLLILIYSVIWAIPVDTAGNGQNNI